MSKFGALYSTTVGSHTDDEWQALVRKYGWRCFYCGSPVSAWHSNDGRILEIRSRNAEKAWESSGRMLAFTNSAEVDPRRILTKDHLVPLFHNSTRVDYIWNIRPADMHCNRLKGQKTVSEFLNERPGLIFGWLNTLPAEDWRVQEWNAWQTNQEVEASIEARLRTDVENEAQTSTGVFAFASAVGVEVDCPVVNSIKNAFAVPPLPLPAEDDDRRLLRQMESERASLRWWSRA